MNYGKESQFQTGNAENILCWSQYASCRHIRSSGKRKPYIMPQNVFYTMNQGNDTNVNETRMSKRCIDKISILSNLALGVGVASTEVNKASDTGQPPSIHEPLLHNIYIVYTSSCMVDIYFI